MTWLLFSFPIYIGENHGTGEVALLKVTQLEEHLDTDSNSGSNPLELESDVFRPSLWVRGASQGTDV